MTIGERSRSSIAQTHTRREDRHRRPRHVEDTLGHERDDDAANLVRCRDGPVERVEILEREASHAVDDRLGAAARVAAQRLAGEMRSEEHTSELQSLRHLVCRLLLEKKKKKK